MTKLIAEIGINHNGSYKIANKICDFLCKIDAWVLSFNIEILIIILNKENQTRLARKY